MADVMGGRDGGEEVKTGLYEEETKTVEIDPAELNDIA